MTKARGKTAILKYNPSEIEQKWQKFWEENRTYQPDLDASASLSTRKPFYNLMMFPYPSAEGLHVGNMYAFTGSDVYGRLKRMQGSDVFEPIGLDGFGIHSENYALKVGLHPKEQAKKSEENFYRQLRATGNGFDWSRKLETYDPQYYKWTQWIFIQLFKKGLAYRKKASVNFCPQDKTVLADEQVLDGKCERCSSIVEKRDLEQWFFKITDYAERLLNNIDKLDWSEKVKIAQRQWIGKSEGTEVEFRIKNSELRIKVFTTRPDTLHGATFMVLAPEHEIAKQTAEKNKEVNEYIKKAQARTEQERISEGKEKTGISTGLIAINPVNDEEIPVWVADYVLMGYGTGAIMAVPAHDERDFEFALKYSLSIKPVIGASKESEDLKEPYVGAGEIINSGEWNGLRIPDEIGKIIEWLEKKGIAKREVQYHLRDWLISRQRYWGPPIPLVFCENCAKRIQNSESRVQNQKYSKGEIENPGWIAVKEENLPVLLPDVKDWKPKGIHSSGSLQKGGQAGQAVESPLAGIDSFVNTKCPNCGGDAKRETDVSDTFLDSAWYFFRYIASDKTTEALDRQRVEKWLPVDMYIGGAEHSVLHLLYSRFVTMVFKDLGLISFEEPYSKFRAHGLLIKEGAKMSKSRGNVVIPDEYIKKFGADTLRLYLMFLGPFMQGGDFYDTGIEGMHRFAKRVWTLSARISNFKFQISNEGQTMMHKTIKKVTEDIENLRYNTAISALMEYYNFLSKQKEISKEEIKTLLLLIAPFAPHLSEELWSRIGEKSSIHISYWPSYDPKFLEDSEVTIIVQINGKMRDTLKISQEESLNQQLIEKIAKENQKVERYLSNRKINKVVYIKTKVINFVVE